MNLPAGRQDTAECGFFSCSATELPELSIQKLDQQSPQMNRVSTVSTCQLFNLQAMVHVGLNVPWIQVEPHAAEMMLMVDGY